jgi:diguanylate cyclase (GGDEF)-like protein
MELETKTIHILLIDDDEDDYLILREYLNDLGDQVKYVVDWVQTYQAGLMQIQRAKHEVYLIDHYLGINSGLDLLKEAIKAGCQAPMIIVTGQSNPEIDQAALQAGATDYLVKDQMNGQLLERSIRYALERNELLKKIRDLAIRDPLTSLYNRRELHRFLDNEIIKSRRYNHSFSVLMIDVDHFKEINDRFGHRIGDEILQQVTQALVINSRGCDLSARYGGDEFTIVLPETSADQAWNSAERLRKVVEALSIQVINENKLLEKIPMTICIGVAEYPVDASTGDALIDKADQALYQAKQLGSNRVVQFHTKQENEQGSK